MAAEAKIKYPFTSEGKFTSVALDLAPTTTRIPERGRSHTDSLQRAIEVAQLCLDNGTIIPLEIVIDDETFYAKDLSRYLKFQPKRS